MKIKSKTKIIIKRESGIELLRILAIFFVITIHLVNQFTPEANAWIANIINIITYPAIFCYSFITGYFIFNSNQEKKLFVFLKLSIELIIWRILISCISIVIETFIFQWSLEIVGKQFIDLFEGLFNYRLWYFWAFLIVYLIFIFINSYFVNNYSRAKKYYFILFSILIGISVVTTIFQYTNTALIYRDQHSFLIILIAAMFGGLWKIIEKDKKFSYSYKTQIIGLLIITMCFFSNFGILLLLNNQASVFSYYNIFYFLSGWGYFLIFKSFRINSKIINYVAKQTWGVYILHNGNNLPRGWTYKIFPHQLNVLFLAILCCYLFALVLTILVTFIDEKIWKKFKFKVVGLG